MSTANETQLKKLEQILNIVNDGLNKDDFIKAFEMVVNIVKQIQGSNKQEIATMHENIALLTDKLKADNTSDVADLKRQVMETLDGVVTAHQDKMDAVDQRLATLKNGEPGPQGDPGADGSPDTGIEIRNKLESLQADERLDMSAIRGLAEALKAIPQSQTTPIFGPRKTKIIRVDLSDQLDGVTKQFHLGTHFGIISVDSSSSPFGAFREVTDYNELGKDILFTDNVDPSIALAQGQSLIVKILK